MQLLHSGTLRATPSQGMWPLVCHEIGLSYDQEERLRQRQRSVLANSGAWLHRHTALATQQVIDSVTTALGGGHEAAKRRERKLMSILTPEQRIKFLVWANRRSHVARRLAESKSGGVVKGAAITCGSGGGDEGESFGEEDKYKTLPDRHVSANLYIIDHRLSKVKQRIPLNTPNFVHPTKLKKLSRRPSFESLAGRQGEPDSHNSKQLNRETSFPSIGSLKRSLDAALGNGSCMDSSGVTVNSPQTAVTPESAHAAGQEAAMATLNDVLPIVPKLAFCYSSNPNPHYAMFPPSQVVPSTQSKILHPAAATLQAPNLSQQQYSLPLPPETTSIAVPSPLDSYDIVDDIPMPTPVSVLLRTSDDFIMEAYEEPLDAVSPPSIAAADSDIVVPEVTSSSTYCTDTSAIATGTRLLLNNRHQSAPQLYSSPLRIYPSFLPAAPMAVIPESSTDNPTVEQVSNSLENPVAEQLGDVAVESRGDSLVDFALEDLPEIEIEANDWAIGEGFYMDIDQEGAAQ